MSWRKYSPSSCFGSTRSTISGVAKTPLPPFTNIITASPGALFVKYASAFSPESLPPAHTSLSAP